jgi:hypothetical protein
MAEKKRERAESDDESVTVKVGSTIHVSRKAVEMVAAIAAAKVIDEVLHCNRYIGELKAINTAQRLDNENWSSCARHYKQAWLQAEEQLATVQQQLREQNAKLARLSLKWERRVIDEDLQ